MEKWRRFGISVLALGISLVMMGVTLIFSMFGFLFMIIGAVLMVVWAVVKKEAIMLFTPGGSFKIEGSAGFIDTLWNRISQIQHERDV